MAETPAVPPLDGNTLGRLGPFQKQAQYWRDSARSARHDPTASHHVNLLNTSTEMSPREPDPSHPVREEQANRIYRENERRQGGRHRGRDSSRRHAHTLRKAAEYTNRELERTNAPGRFRVYERDGDVFVDIVVLDDKGEVTKETVKNISAEDFQRWIESARFGKGLFVDLNMQQGREESGPEE